MEQHTESKGLTGLSLDEVRRQQEQGNVNKVTTMPERTIKDIFRTNFITPFNILNLVLLGLVLIAGKPVNGTFAFVILFNTFIGTFQEIKAKKQLDKLAVLNTEDAIVLRAGEFIAIPVEEIVLGDIIKYDAGKQITVDGIVKGENAEVDESLLTGEADAIVKKVNDVVYSGSFVVAGSILVEATKIGDDIYANKLASEAKNFSMAKSELGQAMNVIIKIVSWLIIPVGLALLFTQLFGSGNTWQNALVNAVAGIIGMIPEGLVLLTSVAFMVGAVRLSQKQTLVQDLPAIESLARVDTLCLDKTGTLTKGTLHVSDIIYPEKNQRTQVDLALAALAKHLPAANVTQIALQEKFTDSDWTPSLTVPFSSKRKWSGITFINDETWILGAPEMLLQNTTSKYKETVEHEQEIGNRVLCLSASRKPLESDELPDDLVPLAFIIFEDIIRENAEMTLAYFAEQGVDIKIISGDNPITVSAIGKKVSLQGAEKWIDAQILPESIEELQEYVKEYTVFGRVTPKQKQDLIKAMQLNGHTVGMTGDGVNDVLALKQADCSIAMANGSEATRTVAQLVLMHSDFASLPLVVNEGRKVINNIQRVASLYLVKTLYSTILSLLFIILMKPYPFQPIQLSVISALMVGIPTFFLALETNTEKVEGSFLEKVFRNTVPAALSIALAIISVYVFGLLFSFTIVERSTVAFIVLGGMQFYILYRVSRPMKPWKIAMLALIFASFIFTVWNQYINAIIEIGRLSVLDYLAAAGILLLFIFIYIRFKGRIKIIFEKYKDRLSKIFEKFL